GKIRDGSIKIRGGIDRLLPDGVVFEDGRTENFEVIILATGFRPDLRRLVRDVDTCSTTRARRSRWAARRRLRVFISADRSPHRPANCARSVWKLGALPRLRAAISRCRADKASP